MAKIHVIGHRRSLDVTLACLQSLRAIHLIDVSTDPSVPLPPMALDESHRREVEDLRYLKARLDGLLALADEAPGRDAGVEPVDLDVVRAQLTETAPAVEGLVERLDDLVAQRESLPRHLEVLRRLLPLVPAFPEFETYDIAAVILDARHAGVLGELNAELEEILGGNFEVISARVDSDTVGAVVVFPKHARAEVDSAFGHEQVSRVRLPREYESIPFRQAIGKMEQRLDVLPVEIDTIKGEISALVRSHSGWRTASAEIGDRLGQLQAIRRLGATPHTFILSGWAPRSRLGEVTERLAREVGEGLVVEVVEPEKGERPPVLLENPAPARPFQSLVGLLALPRASSLDPTVLMAIFLPLFFGMMLGDVAYGGVVFAVSLLVGRRLRGRSPFARDLARVLTLSGAWSVVWGAIYGEFLGDLGRRWWGWEPLWIDREEALEPLLIFALAIGGAHVMLGVVLGVVQGVRDRDRHVTTERVGTLISLVGLFLIAGVVAGRLPGGVMTPAVAAVLVGLVATIVIGGPMGLLMGPLELMGVVGNVLSYLRIAAIGLASVYLARVANELGATGPIWMGVIVASLFHALNLVLGTFSPTIQALRLHYVEFFGRFFEEGGKAFEPFGGESQSSRTREPTRVGKE